MGRGHGGSRGSGGAKGFQGDASMRGYTAGLAKAVTDRESEIRDFSEYEKISIFDEKGNEVFRNDHGNAHSATYDPTKAANNIMTHNHPEGGSFSWKDVTGAIGTNMKEIRAVGSQFTYSLKRPERGWRIGGYELGTVRDRYNSIMMSKAMAAKSYVLSYKGDRETAMRRASFILAHQTMKQLSKEYGWTYTVTKSK